MTVEQLLLTQLMEECAEVAQRASKAIRFGLYETEPNQAYTNKERLLHEIQDFLGTLKTLEEYDVIHLPDHSMCQAIDAKVKKVENYLIYSRECGVLDD